MEKYQQKIGCFLHIPNVGRGQLKFIGPVDTKPGIYAGIDLLANIGKNDGSFKNKRYFSTEYPQSGLFIQLQKVASLIENAQAAGSRRDTLSMDSNLNHMPLVGNRVSSTGSTGSIVIRRPISTEPKSPTPVRERSYSSNTESMSEIQPRKQRAYFQEDKSLKPNEVTDYDGDLNMIPTSSVPSRRVSSESPLPNVLQGYELKIEKQEKEIAQFKRLLDDQRIVLEEIQPTIDQYENSLREMEMEMDALRHRLKQEQQQQQKLKQFSESEHEQLLAVVDELHEEIKANERRVMAAHGDKLEKPDLSYQAKKKMEDMTKQVELYEVTKAKWMKEKEQLKLQNESLNREYQALSKEFYKLQNDGADSKSRTENENEVVILREQLHNANKKISQLQEMLSQASHERSPTYGDDNSRFKTVESLPLFEPKLKIDATAGRDSWCALCEKEGHESIDCPYELPLVDEKAGNIPSSSNEQLLF